MNGRADLARAAPALVYHGWILLKAKDFWLICSVAYQSSSTVLYDRTLLLLVVTVIVVF